jgi:predicted DNA-binding transcriptional regulator AlpA
MLSFSAAARRVDRAPQTLLRWIEAGEFPAPVTINKRRYYWPETIDGWLAKTYAAAGISVGIEDGNREPARV